MIYKKYYFHELSSEEAKEAAVENVRCIAVQYEWWANVYLDAERIGLIITDFDLESKMIEGKLIDKPSDVKEYVFQLYGEASDMYRMMLEYEIGDEDFDEEEFKNALLEEYLGILQSEYGYLHSDENILNSIVDNRLQFDSNGRLA